MTASIPRHWPSRPRTTGIPPPPAAITTWVVCSAARTASIPRILSGRGEGTTLRHPRGILADGPAIVSRERLGAIPGEERPDRLGGTAEGRIIDIDFHFGEKRDHARFDADRLQSVSHRLLEHESHRTLGLRDGDVERLGRDLGGGLFALDQDVADLGTVTVNDHQPVSVTDDLGQPAGGLPGAGELFLLSASVLGAKQGVAANATRARGWRCAVMQDRRLGDQAGNSSLSSGIVMQ